VSIEVADLRAIGDARPGIVKVLREFATGDAMAADVIRVVPELLSGSLSEGRREPVRLPAVRLPIGESASRAWDIDLGPPWRVWNPVGCCEPS
jgi:hypothetical protein